MEILLFIDYGPNKLTKELQEEINKYPFPLCRAKIVDFIETYGQHFELSCYSDYDAVYKLANSFYGIQNVDINRPWHIAEYDGKEYVEYLDYDVIDEKMNYCKLRE